MNLRVFSKNLQFDPLPTIRHKRVLDVLTSHKLGLENKQYDHIKNFVTGKVFSQEAPQQIVDCEKNGDKIYDEIIQERLQPDTVGIFTQTVKKLQLNCFKKQLCKLPDKLKGRIAQLGDDANIWRKMAVISKSREIDCTKIISNHELLHHVA